MSLPGSFVRLVAAGIVLAAAVAACSGDSFEPGETIYTGIIIVPPEQQCEGCTSVNVEAQLLELEQNQPPRIIKCVRTNERGIYDTSTPNTCPERSNGQLPPGDGQRTVIVVATVNSQGGQIGGLISSRLGSVTQTDFNSTTHVACTAGLFLVAGTESFGDPGCMVRASCPSGAPNCFPSLAPNDVDEARIDTLEAAGELIGGQVDFTTADGSNRAACAVIVCTQAGTVPATQECLEQQLAS
ncbi:MAG TPA: hypothetical protein VIS07_00785 [Candidatus Binatia bacterium]